MKRKELKSKILDAYTTETPDLCSKILDTCKKTDQEPKITMDVKSENNSENKIRFNFVFRRVIAVAVCIVLFVSGLSIGFFIPNENKETVVADVENYVYIDVNPSIELQTDSENTVLKCVAANEDAEIILEGLRLDGVEMNTALTAIVGSMFVNGYLGEESNSILVSVDGKDDNATNDLLSIITSNINKTFEKSNLECSIIAQGVDVDENLRQKAKKNNVSVGKMHLVDKMVGGLEDYEQEDEAALASMSIKDLNLIYNSRPDKGGEKDPFDEDISGGKVKGVLEEDEALNTILESIGVDSSEIESYDIEVKMGKDNKKHKTVYTMNIKFKDDENIYNYEVGCEEGDIVKKDNKEPNKKPNEDKEHSADSILNSNESNDKISKDEIDKHGKDEESNEESHGDEKLPSNSNVQEEVEEQPGNETNRPIIDEKPNDKFDEEVELPSDLNIQEDIGVHPEDETDIPNMDERPNEMFDNDADIPIGSNNYEDIEDYPGNMVDKPSIDEVIDNESHGNIDFPMDSNYQEEVEAFYKNEGIEPNTGNNPSDSFQTENIDRNFK